MNNIRDEKTKENAPIQNGIILNDTLSKCGSNLATTNNCLGVYHIYLTILFFLEKIYPLAIYNAISAIFYLLFVRILIKKRNFTISSILSFCEISLAAIVSSLCIGNETGFSAYNIATIVGIFYVTYTVPSFKENLLIAYSFSALSMVCFILNYVMSFYITPMFPLKNISLVRILYISNNIICCVMMIIYCYLLVDTIKNGNHQLEMKYSEIDELSNKDPLTHLNNRKTMNSLLEENIENLRLSGKRFCIAIGDLDNFKYINDTYGHKVGDAVLVAVACRIMNCIRENDSICRWGGDSFLLLINESIESASMISERIRNSIEEEPIKIGDTQISITITFGVCESIPGYKLNELLQEAEDNLHHGKQNGKNQIIL